MIVGTPQAPIGSIKHNITRLLPRHFKIVDLTLAGHEVSEIADAVGVNRSTIQKLQRSPLFQAELVRRRKEDKVVEIEKMSRSAILGRAKSVLTQATEKAAETQVSLLNSEDDSIKLRAASSLLDRAFGKTEDVAPIIHISTEQVQLLTIALKESSNATNPQQFPDSPDAHTPQNGRQNVHEAPEARHEGTRCGDGEASHQE